MSWLMFLIVGFAAGVVAKATLPKTNEESAGWLLTTLLGVAGALAGGFVGDALGVAQHGLFGAFLTSALGAGIIIGMMRLFASSKSVV